MAYAPILLLVLFAAVASVALSMSNMHHASEFIVSPDHISHEFVIVSASPTTMHNQECTNMINGIRELIHFLQTDLFTDKSSVAALQIIEAIELHSKQPPIVHNNATLYAEHLQSSTLCDTDSDRHHAVHVDEMSTLKRAISLFTVDDTLTTRHTLIIISTSTHHIHQTNKQICTDIRTELMRIHHVDVFVVDVQSVGSDSNIDTVDDTPFWQCITESDMQEETGLAMKLCRGARGHDDDFHLVNTQCLFPEIRASFVSDSEWRIRPKSKRVLQDWTFSGGYPDYKLVIDQKEDVHDASTDNYTTTVSEETEQLVQSANETEMEEMHPVVIKNKDLAREFEEYELAQYRHWIRMGVSAFVGVNCGILVVVIVWIVCKKRRKAIKRRKNSLYENVMKNKIASALMEYHERSETSDGYDETSSEDTCSEHDVDFDAI